MTEKVLSAWERFLRSCNTAGGHIVLLLIMFCLLPAVGCTSAAVDDYRKAIFGALLLAMNSARGSSPVVPGNGQTNGHTNGHSPK
jgi:hypothetical protein